ncbi:MAG TPA: barstar family protein [Noviherbaspirillum sp.]|uniref:barstar family protein n=1 Tax=Noviherbaspirillum sp. TaxID=1926288 RepID=UPI002B46DFEB|nr:barstar family protein [Noviherbaspirillum sp.]HJV84012.1 barstar family protein [Noviherbaspirillum sp.]
MPSVRLDSRKITSWAAFHEQCKAAFGFPDFYGRNMDAWIDCLSGLRDDDGMSSFRLKPAETLEIELLHTDILRKSAPSIFAALEECVAEVNERYAGNGEQPALNLLLR